jgi:hypothetical protein
MISYSKSALIMRIMHWLLCLLLLVATGCTTPAIDTPSATATVAIPASTPTFTALPATATPTSTPRPSPTPIAVARLCPPASSEAEWECQDLEIAIKSRFPDDIKIRRRYSITELPIGPLLEVDVWLPSDADLTTWLEKQNAPNLFPVQEPNGAVGGHPAIFWVTDPPHSSFNALVSDGTYIYKAYYVISCHEDGLPAVCQMLDTFRFAGEPAVPAEIPEDVLQQARAVCE